MTKTRVEHLNSDRAKEFLNELEENDLQNQLKKSNSNLPGFLGNFFQGSQQHVKVSVFVVALFFNRNFFVKKIKIIIEQNKINNELISGPFLNNLKFAQAYQAKPELDKNVFKIY